MKKLIAVLFIFFVCFGGVRVIPYGVKVTSGGGGGGTCASCTEITDGKVVDNGNTSDGTGASTIIYRARRFSVGAGGLCITTCFDGGLDGGDGATVTCTIVGNDGTTNCGNSTYPCPDMSNVIVAESSAVGVPDTESEYEIPFASANLVPQGNNYYLVYHYYGTMTNHQHQIDSSAQNYDTAYSSDGSSWSPSNTDTIHGAYGCTP